MNDERALAQVRELEDIITQLNRVRDRVSDFRIFDYDDAGGGKWAGQKRKRFVSASDDAKSDFAKISDQIGDAIGECKSRQRSLAYSIDAFKSPDLSVQAIFIALN